jgi:hypothetical protein
VPHYSDTAVPRNNNPAEVSSRVQKKNT